MFNYDVICEAALENGFDAKIVDAQVEVFLKHGFVLVFRNFEDDNDTLIFFKDGGEWHSHGDLWEDRDLAVVAIDILNGLKAGSILIEKTVSSNGGIELALTIANQIGDVNCYLHAGDEITFVKLQ